MSKRDVEDKVNLKLVPIICLIETKKKEGMQKRKRDITQHK